MTTHTPGPWAWFPAKAGAVDPTVPHMKFVTGGDGQGLAHTPGLFEPLDTANANLIAAAPDLLRSAKAAWHLCESLLAERDGATTELIVGVSVALRTAIAKAEGTP